jgi:hypothetical protein
MSKLRQSALAFSSVIGFRFRAPVDDVAHMPIGISIMIQVNLPGFIEEGFISIRVNESG